MKRGLVMLAVLLMPTRAFAQDAAAAESLYNEASALRAKKDFATACPKFVESYRLDPSESTLVMVADCEERDGKIADAWAHLQEAIPKLKDPPRLAYAKKLSVSLEKRVPHLTVTLAPGAPEGTVVKRDGVELRAGSLGASLPVNPGERTVVVTAPGRKTTTKTVTVAEGKVAQIEVSVGEPGEALPVVAAATPETGKHEPPAAPTPGGGRKTAGYVVGAVGVVGLGVAGVTGILLASKRSEMTSANCEASTKICSGPNAANGANAASSGAPIVPVFYGALAVGVVGVAAGAYLIFSSSDDAAALRVGPTGATLEGRF